jgi:hypothetical protein
VAEWANSHLKDGLTPHSIYVKGYKKISFVFNNCGNMLGHFKVPSAIYSGILEQSPMSEIFVTSTPLPVSVMPVPPCFRAFIRNDQRFVTLLIPWQGRKENYW